MGEVLVLVFLIKEDGHAVVDGGNEVIGVSSEHGDTVAEFGVGFPEASGVEPLLGGAAEEVGAFVGLGAGPLVVGDQRDEAGPSGEGFFPNRAFEIVATGVIDDTEAFALKAPAHFGQGAVWKNDGSRIGATNESGFRFVGERNGRIATEGERDFFGFLGRVESVAHSSNENLRIYKEAFKEIICSRSEAEWAISDKLSANRGRVDCENVGARIRT